VDKTDATLLNSLRIGGGERETGGGGVPRWLWIVVAVVLALVAAGGGAWWWFAGRPVEVRTAAALAPGSGDAAAGGAILQATGYVTARRQATVSTQITGTLTQVLIEEGDVVKQGQVIARLEDSGLRAALGTAEAQVQVTRAQVAQTQAQLAQAEADLRRQEELVKSGWISPQAAELSRTAVKTTAAQVQAALRQSEGALANLQQAKVNFDYTVVRAPFAGVVTEKAAQVGEIVSPLSAGGGFTRTGVGTIVDMDSLEIDVDVNEAYIGQVQPGMPAQSVLDAYPDWKIASHVIAIVPSADKGKATVKVRVALEQKDRRLVPNMAARVSFLAPKTGDATAAAPLKGVLVPAEAIVQRDGKPTLFVVADAHAHARTVTVAPRDVGTLKLVADGVKAGERVVLGPPAELRDGAAVTIAGAPR
jgi:RND family efflux transporter MFP subunit